MNVNLNFKAASVDPIDDGDVFGEYLLYNQCDGYHIAYAHFAEGVFDGFRNFLGTCSYERDFYAAWAKLPDCNDVLYPAFGRTREERDAIRALAAASTGVSKEQISYRRGS